MRKPRAAILIGCAAVVALSLGACREDEQGRVLLYQKGVYLGKADTEPSEQARRGARNRMNYLGRDGGMGGGGGAPSRAPDVRPPARAVSPATLRQRTRYQSAY